MIQLTPIDQTVVGQELIQMGIERGEKEIREKTARSLLSYGTAYPGPNFSGNRVEHKGGEGP